VLADDHRTLFAVLDTLGQEQDAVGDYVREDVHDHLVAGAQGLVVDLTGAGIRLQRFQLEPANDLGSEDLTIGLNRC